jgi:hypothetical protein
VRNLESRVTRLERDSGGTGDGYTTVILRDLGLWAPPDPQPIWHGNGRVLIVDEGYEHLGRERLQSLGIEAAS